MAVCGNRIKNRNLRSRRAAAGASEITAAARDEPDAADQHRRQDRDAGIGQYAKRNVLGATTVEKILRALASFEGAGVRAVVVRTATPSAVWSAGHDIDELPVRGVDPLPFADPLEELLRAVRGYPGAVIAMVHGTVWGGACDLVLNCDMVVGDDTAAFAVTPARLGLPYSGIQYFLARLPLNVVNELIMTADLNPPTVLTTSEF